MIKSFRDSKMERVWRREYSKRLPREIQERALMKLQQLNAAGDLKDLSIPTSNQLEALKGSRKGQYSIRVNKQWRVCFRWLGGHALNVEITDTIEAGEQVMAARKIKLTHPGKILREEFMEAVGMSAYALAKALSVPLPRVNDIVREKRSISPEMAVLLSTYFGTSDEYWVTLQAHFDLTVARAKVAKQASRISPHPHDANGALQPI